MSDLWVKRSHPLSIAGVGLLALDLVEVPGVPSQASAGGSCANVLLALAFLGWHAHAIGRLREDRAGREIRADFGRWGVNTTLIALEPLAATPVIRHIILDKDGERTHRFSLKCQRCGKWLPTYSAVTRQAAAAGTPAADLMNYVDVLYIDRPSPAAAMLAKNAYESGALVVFEPSGDGAGSAFQSIASIAHVIKYSRHQGIRWPLPQGAKPLLEVETRGGDGLRYRTRRWRTAKVSEWLSLPAIPTGGLRDAAGAGDWTTAGMLQVLGHAWAGKAFSRETAVAALNCGQALAAWTCAFEGARGGMRVEPPSVVKRRVSVVLRMDKVDRLMSVPSATRVGTPVAETYCVTCAGE